MWKVETVKSCGGGLNCDNTSVFPVLSLKGVGLSLASLPFFLYFFPSRLMET